MQVGPQQQISKQIPTSSSNHNLSTGWLEDDPFLILGFGLFSGAFTASWMFPKIVVPPNHPLEQRFPL